VAPPGNQAATEKTNINLYHPENPVYSPKVGSALKHSAKGIERSEQIQACKEEKIRGQAWDIAIWYHP
jgi:hypothetical protein